MKNYQKGFVVPLLVIVVMLAIGGGAYYFGTRSTINTGTKISNDILLNEDTTPSITNDTIVANSNTIKYPLNNTEKEIDASNWKTYTNSEFGYSFIYPNDWILTNTNPSSRSMGFVLQSGSAVVMTGENPIRESGYENLKLITTEKLSDNLKKSVFEDTSNPNQVRVHITFNEDHFFDSGEFWFVYSKNDLYMQKVIDKIIFSTYIKLVSNIPVIPSEEDNLIEVSKQVLLALKNKDYQKLEDLTSSEGLSWNETSDLLDLTKRDISKQDISNIPTNTTKYLFGYTDGKGDPIVLTISDYLDKWIYNHDYLNAPVVSVNTINKITSNIPNYIVKYSAGRSFVSFHFDGFDPSLQGMDWTTMYLIFDEQNGEFKLRGIVKANWTI